MAIVQEFHNLGSIRKVIFTCGTDTAGSATFAAVALTQAIEGFLLELETNPGTTAPTDDYNITLVDADGFDVLQSVGLLRDTANTEKVQINYATNFHHPAVSISDTLTLTIADNAVNNATMVITLYYSPIGP